MTRTCDHCGASIDHKRADARFCDSTCRARHSLAKAQGAVTAASARHPGTRKPTRYIVLGSVNGHLQLLGQARAHDAETAIRRMAHKHPEVEKFKAIPKRSFRSRDTRGQRLST